MAELGHVLGGGIVRQHQHDGIARHAAHAKDEHRDGQQRQQRLA
jgi:hypothetical protein